MSNSGETPPRGAIRPRRVLIAFDKFKDALTAPQACATAARALRDRPGDWQIDLCPLSDGGEGFVEILTHAAGGRRENFPVAGPRGGLVEAPIGRVAAASIPAAARVLLELEASPPEAFIAVMEMAAASGLALLEAGRRDPWQATSYGTGQLIRVAADQGAAMVLLGVGGSATHDLGLGALGALGLEFRAADGKKIPLPTPALWPELADFAGGVFSSLPPIRIACDVTNPLLGPRGAAAVFAPQKGLKPEDYDRLEAGSARLAVQLCRHAAQSSDLSERPGAGAAGGLAFGLMAGARAQLLPGFGLVSAWLDLDARLDAADMVITGEGRFDSSSLGGKGPGAIAARAAALNKPVHIFAGKIDVVGKAATSLHSITPEGTPLEQALRDTAANLAAAIAKTF